MSLITVTVQRFNPETDKSPYLQEFQVRVTDRSTVLESLMYIYEQFDGSLAFRFGCRFKNCGLCAVEVNGKPKMACLTPVQDGDIISPLKNLPVIRDLVVDRSKYFQSLKEYKLYLDRPVEGKIEQLIEPEEHRQLIKCKECLACQATCPLLSKNEDFPGPYVWVKLAQLMFDPRDGQDRKAQAQRIGINYCRYCQKCYCINGIPLGSLAIKPLLDKSNKN